MPTDKNTESQGSYLENHFFFNVNFTFKIFI